MSTTTPTTTLPAVPRHILARQPFVAGSMRGETLTWRTNWGRLPAVYAEDLDYCVTEARKRQGTTFVVWSYATPIAWTTPEGDLVVPPVRYTATTTRHQAVAREAF